MTPGDYGGQRANMEHDSMAGTLACQARLIWPKEREILRRTISPGSRVLDIACGTGEILHRIRAELEPAIAIGVDLFRGHLDKAGPPVVQADAHRLPFDDHSFDVVCVRHLLQALPDPVALLTEARRVGRRIHLLVEDYAGLLFDLDDMAAENHFVDVAPRFRSHGTDLYQGRRAFRHLRAAGFSNVEVQPLIVDNRTRDRREAFAGVLHYWKLGYAKTLAGLLELPVEEVEGRFDAMISAVGNPDRYCAWLLFVLTAKA